MTERPCLGCGQPLDGEGRADRRYHGLSCRKAAYRRRQRERETAPVTLVPPPPPIDPHAVLERALSEDALLIPIVHAARTQWRASAWLLERRYPQRWAHGAEPDRLPDRAIVRHLMSLPPPPSDPA